MVNSVVVPSRDDDAVQEYLDLLLKPAAAETKPFAEPALRPLRMPLPPLAPPRVEAPIETNDRQLVSRGSS